MLCEPEPGGLLAFVQVWSCVYSHLFSSVCFMWTKTIFALLVSAGLFFTTFKGGYYEKTGEESQNGLFRLSKRNTRFLWPVQLNRGVSLWPNKPCSLLEVEFLLHLQISGHIEDYCCFVLTCSTILPPLCPFSSVRRSLLRAVWCHPFPGVARLLQRLPQLWVGHWGWARKLHQDQLWQVCETVLQLLSCGNKDIGRACAAFFCACVLVHCCTASLSRSPLFIQTHICALFRKQYMVA